MSEKIYCLLILCGILCLHQILADGSSDHIVRKKRVINLETGGDVPLRNGDAPYVVSIRKSVDHVMVCVGVILSKHTVITSSNCVIPYDASSIQVLVGSSYYQLGIPHEVLMKNVHIGNHYRGNNDGIALLTVAPAIIFDRKASPIELYQGTLLSGTNATIIGWGYNPTGPRGTVYRARLRSITVPVMNHGDCVHRYLGRYLISNNDICTYDANKRCGHTDGGAPLIVHNHLAGIHLWRFESQSCVLPDIFVNLQSLEYASWIRNNIIYNVVDVRRSQ